LALSCPKALDFTRSSSDFCNFDWIEEEEDAGFCALEVSITSAVVLGTDMVGFVFDDVVVIFVFAADEDIGEEEEDWAAEVSFSCGADGAASGSKTI
jgi:hypothetical protein